MKITNRNVLTIIISAIVVLAILTINYYVLNGIQNDAVRILSITFMSTVATVILANVLWEVIARESFSKYLLNQVKISENIAQSGIDTVYVDFKEIDWKTELAKTNSFTAAFIYAYSWRSNNDTSIKTFAKKRSKRRKMRIIVPDPENSNIMTDLDRRFNFENGETRRRIEDCISYYLELGATVYAFDGTMQSTYYLMDDDGIMAFFSHSAEKGSVPAIKASKKGEMYKYIEKDLEAMIQRSIKLEKIDIKIVDGIRETTIRRASDVQ